MTLQDDRPRVWVGHIVLPAPDVAQTHEFMVKLGMRVIQHDDSVSVLELRGGTHLVVIPSDQPASGPAPFDLMVDDLEETRDHLKSQGLEPSDVASGEFHRSFTIDSPSGHTITFNSTHVSEHPV